MDWNAFFTNFLLFQVNEIAWNIKGDMFFLTTGNGDQIFFARKEVVIFLCFLEWLFDFMFGCLGTVEVLSYPSLRPLDTLMAHTAGCYCIAIDPIGRYPIKALLFLLDCLSIYLTQVS